jgi:hypothetical protein
MKWYLRVIGNARIILAFLKLVLLLLRLLELLERRLLRVLVLRRWLNVYSRAHGHRQHNINIQADKTKILKTVQQNITTAHETVLELFYALQRSRGYKER